MLDRILCPPWFTDATSVVRAAATLYMELFWCVYWMRKGREKQPESIQNSAAFSSLVRFYFLLLLLLFSFFAQLLRAVSTSQRRRLFIWSFRMVRKARGGDFQQENFTAQTNATVLSNEIHQAEHATSSFSLSRHQASKSTIQWLRSFMNSSWRKTLAISSSASVMTSRK